MRFAVYLGDRFFTIETGTLLDDIEPEHVSEPDEPPVVHVPMGFTAITQETDDDEEWEAPEADCR